MGDYEKEQTRLLALWDEIVSEEENYESSSESYKASSVSSESSDLTDSPVLKTKRRGAKRTPAVLVQPSTSRQIPTGNNVQESEIRDEQLQSETGATANNEEIIEGAIEETIEEVIRSFQWDSDSSSNEIIATPQDLQWNDVTGEHLRNFRIFTNELKISHHIQDMKNKQPIDFFSLFVDESLLNLLVQETNKYAAQKSEKTNLPWARIRNWKDTNIQEMKIFLGLQIWIGLVQMPKLVCYWSNNVLYSNEVKSVMSRNRFELILSNWHFSDNENADISNRLYKIKPLVDYISQKFQDCVTPSCNVCVDETLVPFRGRLAFLQYIKNKRHKFGVKLFKLCIEDGYTYDFKIYCGTEKNNLTDSVPTSIVMELCKNLLDCGRTIFVDNYYTSIELAHKLLNRQTHLVGTLRKNRKGNPKDVIAEKLRKGEVIAKESNSGVVILKWCDKREVLMLTTKHTNTMVTVKSKNGAERQKPEVIKDYNQNKSFIDLSDQIKAYSSCLRRSIKWYRKLAIEIMLGSGIVNAFILYKRVTGKNISITQFREEIAKDLLQISPKEKPAATERHFIEEVDTRSRRRCVICYKNMSEEHGRKYATSKATMSRYKCVQCDKFYCIPCFTSAHNCTL